MTTDKVQRQIELECNGIQAGITAYRKQVDSSSVADLTPGIALMKTSLEPLALAIEEFLKPSRGAAKMREVKCFLAGLKVTPEEMAYLTLRATLEAISGDIKLQTTAKQITDMIMDQHEYAKFKAGHKGYVKMLEQDMKLSTQRHKRTVVMLKKRQKGIEDDHLEQEDRMVIGCKLIELCILATGLVERISIGDRYYLRGASKAQEWVENVHDRCEVLNPHFPPMIVPPRKWETVEGGGYLGNSANLRFQVIKTRNKKALAELAQHQMQNVYDALNVVQETPWVINTRVHEVMAALWDEGSTLAGIPAVEREELPPKPWTTDAEHDQMKIDNPDAVTAWKRQAAAVYEDFIRNKSKRTTTATKIRQAGTYAAEEELYFPHVLDWRCRIYPIPNYINPQSDDIGKALIQFKVGKPLGEDGLKWLKIQLANTYGYDKASIEDRQQWVDDHLDVIQDSAENPLDGARFWCDADSPFCFLAACFEYMEFRKNPSTFVSHLPIAQDGTCSGLQHFSAMLLDAIGGKYVNLIPSDKPQDIYTKVANVVIEMVNRDAANGSEEARLWQGKIDRGIAKRAVMTSPYGAKKYGFKDQLLQELRKRGAGYLSGDSNEKQVYAACIYLAELLWDAIGQVVIAAREAMDWLQEVATVCSEATLPIWWTTPVGFKAHQEYKKQTLKRIDTFWGSARVRLSLQMDTDQMDTKKQVNGIAPNFVHSMDASHLMKTVLSCKEQGVTDLAVIHDSFGTHACNSTALANTLRATFVEQYSTNVLENFRNEVLEQLPEALREKIPPVPRQGTLDLELVKLSTYFFA